METGRLGFFLVLLGFQERFDISKFKFACVKLVKKRNTSFCFSSFYALTRANVSACEMQPRSA